jgi:hypothetical protein
MWKVAAFLSRMDKLPPAVQEYWKTSFGAAPSDEKKDEKKDDGMKH